MNKYFENTILKSTGAKDLRQVEMIQQLWSGYGEILRYEITGCDLISVVVKHVSFPDQKKHPRGWNTDISHQRKLKSYKVETAWYRDYANICDDSCHVPHCYTVEKQGDEVLMVFEDLDSSGYSARKGSVNWEEIALCLSWLANFHATFLGKNPEGLWKVGTYWHLDTRPDELKGLDDLKLKKAAGAIDLKLKRAKYQTFVHGDAKLANFCFAPDSSKVAAVDFQYVGGGCGMKDVAYFIGSCLYEEESAELESQILDCYFEALKKAVEKREINIDFNDLEKEWRELYPVAWTDFHRFIKGWSPGHWKINSYSEKIAQEVIEKL